jgi:hypothetical protein
MKRVFFRLNLTTTGLKTKVYKYKVISSSFNYNITPRLCFINPCEIIYLEKELYIIRECQFGFFWLFFLFYADFKMGQFTFVASSYEKLRAKNNFLKKVTKNRGFFFVGPQKLIPALEGMTIKKPFLLWSYNYFANPNSVVRNGRKIFF